MITDQRALIVEAVNRHIDAGTCPELVAEICNILNPGSALPPEPEEGMWAEGADVWVRIDDDDDPEGRWYVTGNTETFRWRHVSTRNLVRLVEDPAANAPALPWRGKDRHGNQLTIHRDGDQLIFRIGVGIYATAVDLETAVEGAQAVLRAAGEAANT